MKPDIQCPDNAVVSEKLRPQESHHSVQQVQPTQVDQVDEVAPVAIAEKSLVFRQGSQPRRRFWFAVVTTCALSFLLGFCLGERLPTKRKVDQKWQFLFSILEWGLKEGKVDEYWITELRIIKHESEWDD